MVNEKITLEEAFQLLEEHYSDEKDIENFIGFTHPDNDNVYIQFTRHTASLWTIDIPQFKQNEYVGSLSGKIIHDNVFAVVLEFFNGNSKFQKYILDTDYDSLLKLCKNRWGLYLENITE